SDIHIGAKHCLQHFLSQLNTAFCTHLPEATMPYAPIRSSRSSSGTSATHERDTHVVRSTGMQNAQSIILNEDGTPEATSTHSGMQHDKVLRPICSGQTKRAR